MFRRKLKSEKSDADDADSRNSFVERRRALSKSIANLREPQRLYIPASASFIDAIDPTFLAEHPESVELWLPSAFPFGARDAQCVKGLPQLEYRLRYAQAVNALQDIRRLRRLIKALATKIQSHIASTQKTVTKTRSLFDKVMGKQAQAVSAYRTLWKAIAKLAPGEEFGKWKEGLKELKDSDIRGPGREEYEVSDSRFIQSWIWTSAARTSTSTSDHDLNPVLRVEWCKAQARASRHEEEVELVVEEMRRTLVSFEGMALQWTKFATSPIPQVSTDSSKSGVGPRKLRMDETAVLGVTAYAHRQANIYHRMIHVFLDDWYPILDALSLGSTWLSNYPRPVENKRRRLVSNVPAHRSTLTSHSDDSATQATPEMPTTTTTQHHDRPMART